MFHKTPQRDRCTYKYSYTIDGEQCTYTCTPGKDGITELDIKRLHQMDDNEVENNLKNHKPKLIPEQRAKIEAWRQEYIAHFTSEHGYPPHPADVSAAVEEVFPKNWCHSINALMDGTDEGKGPGDGSSILASVALGFEVDEPEHISRLHDIVAEMPEAWQDIYAHVIVGGMTNTVYAKLHGKTEGAVRKTVGKIQKRIAEDELLKKLFLRGTN